MSVYQGILLKKNASRIWPQVTSFCQKGKQMVIQITRNDEIGRKKAVGKRLSISEKLWCYPRKHAETKE